MRATHRVRATGSLIHLHLLDSVLQGPLLQPYPIREPIECPPFLHRVPQVVLFLMPSVAASAFNLLSLCEHRGLRVTCRLPFEKFIRRHPCTGFSRIALDRLPHLCIERQTQNFSILEILASAKQIHAQDLFHLGAIASYCIEFHAVLFATASKSWTDVPRSDDCSMS